jgi:hypothetical protein
MEKFGEENTNNLEGHEKTREQKIEAAQRSVVEKFFKLFENQSTMIAHNPYFEEFSGRQ